MNYSAIFNALQKAYDHNRIEAYISYLKSIEQETTSTGKPKNLWFKDLTEEKAISLFRSVAIDRLFIDGDTILIGPMRGKISTIYTYQAYKNKLINVYPETTFDIKNVYTGDKFQCEKKNGKIFYSHQLADPFSNNAEERKIIGCYCVIKNKRGEFIETLDLAEIKKISQTSKMANIWKSWFSEMTLKSVIKRACKRQFKDIMINVERNDNENYEPSEVGIDIVVKEKIDNATTLEELNIIYNDHKLEYAHDETFVARLSGRRQELMDGGDIKTKLGSQQFQNALKSIIAGDYSKEELLQYHILSEKQLSDLENAMKNGNG